MSKPGWHSDYYVANATTNAHEHPKITTPYPISNYVIYDHLNPSFQAFNSVLTTQSDPETFKDAISDCKWQSAMNLELRALEENDTCDITSLPSGKGRLGVNGSIKLN